MTPGPGEHPADIRFSPLSRRLRLERRELHATPDDAPELRPGRERRVPDGHQPHPPARVQRPDRLRVSPPTY